MFVELVIGNAPDACVTLISTWTTVSEPSQVVGMPGYWNFRSVCCSSTSGESSRVETERVATLAPAIMTALLITKRARLQEPATGHQRPLTVQTGQFSPLGLRETHRDASLRCRQDTPFPVVSQNEERLWETLDRDYFT